MNQTKQKHTTRTALTAIVACVVAFAMMLTLSVPAFSEESDTFCGKKEHTHTSACYTKELTCGLEESEGHVHTDECYATETVTTLICGQEETPGQEAVYDEEGNLVQEAVPGHVHTDECYATETVTTLICGQEESEGHKHTDECYTKELTCKKEEHKHTADCYSDSKADVETAADWEATLPDELTGVWADDVIAVAESQLGYTESTRNFIKGEGRNFGYSRYGAWYGNAYGDWCAMFVSFCLNYAEIPTKYVPRDSYCPNWVSVLKEKKMFGNAHGEDAYLPKKGDIIFFDWQGDGTVDHVGLVAEVKDIEGVTHVKTIEGNSSDRVQYCNYLASDADIVGYGKLPVNPDDPTVKAKAEAEKAKAAEKEASEASKKASDDADENAANDQAEAKSAKAEAPAASAPYATAPASAVVKSSSNMSSDKGQFATGKTDAFSRYWNAQHSITLGSSVAAAPAIADKSIALPEEVEGDAQRVSIAGKWTNLLGAAASAE